MDEKDCRNEDIIKNGEYMYWFTVTTNPNSLGLWIIAYVEDLKHRIEVFKEEKKVMPNIELEDVEKWYAEKLDKEVVDLDTLDYFVAKVAYEYACERRKGIVSACTDCGCEINYVGKCEVCFCKGSEYKGV